MGRGPALVIILHGARELDAAAGAITFPTVHLELFRPALAAEVTVCEFAWQVQRLSGARGP